MKSSLPSLPSSLGLCALLLSLSASSAKAQETPAPPAPASAETNSKSMLTETAPMPFGEIVEDCIQDKYDLFYVLNVSRYGVPEERQDTVIQYVRSRGTLLIAMYGSSSTADDAKKRLESRKKAVDYAVTHCAKELGKPTKELYGTFVMTYTKVDREAGKQTPLIRWHRGRWELL